MALTYTPPGELGFKMPAFKLPSTTGSQFTSSNLQGTSVIMFICNHCPYVKAIEDRLIETTLRLNKSGIQVIAICSNDPTEYPEDDMPAMKARALEKSYPFTYLQDVEQTVAKNFGAVCTPDFFVFGKDQRLYYRGRLDDSWKDSSQVHRRELEHAALACAQGKPPPKEQIPSMGCSIKWRSNT